MDQVVQLRLRILPKAGRGQGLVVPVISERKAVKAEWIAGYGGVHHAAAGGVRFERLPSAAATNFVLLVSAHEAVLVRIEREQDPQASFRIDVQDDEIAIVFGPHLNFGPVAREEATIVADPKTDRRVGPGCSHRLGGSPGEQQRKEQRGDHGTSQQHRLQRGKYDGARP